MLFGFAHTPGFDLSVRFGTALLLTGEGGVAGDFVDVVDVDVVCRAFLCPGFGLFDVSCFHVVLGVFLERAVARPLSARPPCGVVVGLPHLGEWLLPSFTLAETDFGQSDFGQP